MIDSRDDGVVLPQNRSAIVAAMAHNDTIPEHLEESVNALITRSGTRLAILDAKIEYLLGNRRDESEHDPSIIVETSPTKDSDDDTSTSSYNLDEFDSPSPHKYLILPNLHEARQNEATQLLLYRATISPHRKLPVELLSHIFKDSVDRVWLPKMYDSDSPLVLIRVCAKWRYTAFNTPDLWTEIDIKERKLTKFVPWKVDVLGLSRGLPLFMHLDIRKSPSIERIRQLEMERWLKLEIKGKGKYIQELLLEPAPLCGLHELVIDARTSSRLTLDSAPFLSNSALRVVSLAGNSPFCEFILHIPLLGITHLNLSNAVLDGSTALCVLRRCPSLVRCTVDFWKYPDDTRDGAEDIILPLLEFLDVSLYQKSYLWIKHLAMPKLRHIKFDVEHYFEPKIRFTDACIACLSRSKSLDVLELRALLPVANLEELLQARHTLSKLKCYSPNMLSASILERLSSGELLPKLTTLKCVVETIAGLHAYLDMIESRAQTTIAATINDIKFIDDNSSYLEASASHRLGTLRGDGLSIRFAKSFDKNVD